MIKVYSLPRCPGCDKTKAWLADNGVQFEAVDLTTSPDAMQLVHSLGYRSAPVVYVSNSIHWSGHNPEKLKEVLENG